MKPAGLKWMNGLSRGCGSEVEEKKPREASTLADGVASKVAVKPWASGVKGKLTRWMPDPAGEFTQPAGTGALAIDAAPCTDAVTEIFCETLFVVSEAVTVMVMLPEGVVLVVETVRTADPEPPVIVVVSKLAATVELLEEALSVTVPLKPFTALTLIVNVPAAPAGMACDVGLADKENSELLPPLPEPLTVRRGETTQPFATRNNVANSSANLRMTPLFRRRSRMICFCRESFTVIFALDQIVLRQGGASKQKDNLIGLSGAAQMFAEGRKEMVKS
jgi:hypothetical protein